MSVLSKILRCVEKTVLKSPASISENDIYSKLETICELLKYFNAI